MDMTAILIAATSFITAIGGIIIALITQRSAATKDELESLRKTIAAQREELIRYEDRVDKLEKARDDLWRDNEKLRDCITALEGENIELKVQVKKIQVERAHTETERDNLRAQLNRLQNEKIPALERENQVIRKMIIELGGKPPTGPLK